MKEAIVLDWIERIGLDKTNRMETVAYREIWSVKNLMLVLYNLGNSSR